MTEIVNLGNMEFNWKEFFFSPVLLHLLLAYDSVNFEMVNLKQVCVYNAVLLTSVPALQPEGNTDTQGTNNLGTDLPHLFPTQSSQRAFPFSMLSSFFVSILICHAKNTKAGMEPDILGPVQHLIFSMVSTMLKGRILP